MIKRYRLVYSEQGSCSLNLLLLLEVNGFGCPQDNPAPHDLMHSWGPQLYHLWVGPRSGMPAGALSAAQHFQTSTPSAHPACARGSPYCLPGSLSAIFFNSRQELSLKLMWIASLVSESQDLSAFTSAGLLGLKVEPYFFMWLLGIELSSSCLCSGHFSDWAISPALPS